MKKDVWIENQCRQISLLSFLEERKISLSEKQYSNAITYHRDRIEFQQQKVLRAGVKLPLHVNNDHKSTSWQKYNENSSQIRILVANKLIKF